MHASVQRACEKERERREREREREREEREREARYMHASVQRALLRLLRTGAKLF
jgi:hypothetical protein